MASGATVEVEEWVMGHETAQDMLRRIGPRTTGVAPLVPALQRIVNLHGRHVLEVAGASGSAKSEFLLQVQTLSLLPSCITHAECDCLLALSSPFSW